MFVRARAETLKAYAICARTLSRLISVLGQSNDRCINLAPKIDALQLSNQVKEALSKIATISKVFLSHCFLLSIDNKRGVMLTGARVIKEKPALSATGVSVG